jgi:hypothetical protein
MLFLMSITFYKSNDIIYHIKWLSMNRFLERIGRLDVYGASSRGIAREAAAGRCFLTKKETQTAHHCSSGPTRLLYGWLGGLAAARAWGPPFF